MAHIVAYRRLLLARYRASHTHFEGSDAQLLSLVDPEVELWYQSASSSQLAQVVHLESRHWQITTDGRTEHVSGPGVIGLHPKLSPEDDELFQYCSQSGGSQSTTMTGSFTFARVDLASESQIEVYCPTFGPFGA